MTSERPVTVDSLPNITDIWMMLRRAYGTRLKAATLVAVLDKDGLVTVQTITLPMEENP